MERGWGLQGSPGSGKPRGSERVDRGERRDQAQTEERAKAPAGRLAEEHLRPGQSREGRGDSHLPGAPGSPESRGLRWSLRHQPGQGELGWRSSVPCKPGPGAVGRLTWVSLEGSARQCPGRGLHCHITQIRTFCVKFQTFGSFEKYDDVVTGDPKSRWHEQAGRPCPL